MSDLFGHQLVERDRILEPTARWMRRCGQKAIVGWVSSIHVGMRHSTEDREIVSMLAEDLQIGRKLVISACFLGEEKIGKQAIVTPIHKPTALAAKRSSKEIQP